MVRLVATAIAVILGGLEFLVEGVDVWAAVLSVLWRLEGMAPWVPSWVTGEVVLAGLVGVVVLEVGEWISERRRA